MKIEGVVMTVNTGGSLIDPDSGVRASLVPRPLPPKARVRA